MARRHRRPIAQALYWARALQSYALEQRPGAGAMQWMIMFPYDGQQYQCSIPQGGVLPICTIVQR